MALPRGLDTLSVLSIPTLTTKLPHLWPVSAPTWDQHLDCKHSCRGKARDWGTRKSQGTSRAGWEQVAGSPVASEEPWSHVGLGTKTPHPSHSPPVPFLGEGGLSSPALSQLLQLCSEGSMG